MVQKIAKTAKKALLSLPFLISAALVPACEEEPQGCMEEVSEQTGVEEENLQSLGCQGLLERLPDLSQLPEKYEILKENNALLIGHCSYRGMNLQFLEQLQTCYEHINQFLGITPITQCLIHTYGSGNDLAEIESKYVGAGAAGCILIRAGGNAKQNAECQETEGLEIEKPEFCSYGHEPTHLFIAGTLLQKGETPWLNEGLAELVLYTLNRGSLECYDSGWRSIDINGYSGEETTEEGAYVSLGASRTEHESNGTENAAYKTGACFWKKIMDDFGYESFKAVMKNLERSRFETEMSLEQEVLVPAIGENGLALLKGKFGTESTETYE